MCHLALRSSIVASLAALALSCGPPADEAPFPRDYELVWHEARTPCVISHDHALTYVRVFANDLAYAPYVDADAPYPVGAILLKAEYDDPECTVLESWVVMEKLPGTTPPDEHDWTWRRFDPDRHEVDDPRFIPSTCIDCHDWHCEAPPYGWDYTCTPGALEPDPPR